VFYISNSNFLFHCTQIPGIFYRLSGNTFLLWDCRDHRCRIGKIHSHEIERKGFQQVIFEKQIEWSEI